MATRRYTVIFLDALTLTKADRCDSSHYARSSDARRLTIPMTNNSAITLAITGATGAQYGLRLLEILLQQEDRPVYLLLSSAARVVIKTETHLTLPNEFSLLQEFFKKHFEDKYDVLQVFDEKDWFSPAASGSNPATHMVVCPCSMGTLSAIATGASNNLIERAADVTLKEKKQLILVPREMPFSTLHLRNMTTLSELGATIMPASPGFYHNPASIEDLVDFVVDRILSHLDVDRRLIKPWQS